MDDERFYRRVNDELNDGSANEALWTKAFAQAMGDEKKAQALYIRMRVQQLMQEEVQERRVIASEDEESDEAPEPDNLIAYLKSRTPPNVWNGLQVVIFLIGLSAIWFFREQLFNLGRQFRSAIL